MNRTLRSILFGIGSLLLAIGLVAVVNAANPMGPGFNRRLAMVRFLHAVLPLGLAISIGAIALYRRFGVVAAAVLAVCGTPVMLTLAAQSMHNGKFADGALPVILLAPLLAGLFYGYQGPPQANPDATPAVEDSYQPPTA